VEPNSTNNLEGDNENMYQTNLMCVPKKNNRTGKMTDDRVVRHASKHDQHTLSLNENIAKKHKSKECPQPRLILKN